MAMHPNKQKAIAALLIAHGKPSMAPAMGDSDESSESDSAGPHEGHMAAAEDMMKAIKSGDVEEFAHALHAYIEMCD